MSLNEANVGERKVIFTQEKASAIGKGIVQKIWTLFEFAEFVSSANSNKVQIWIKYSLKPRAPAGRRLIDV